MSATRGRIEAVRVGADVRFRRAPGEGSRRTGPRDVLELRLGEEPVSMTAAAAEPTRVIRGVIPRDADGRVIARLLESRVTPAQPFRPDPLAVVAHAGALVRVGTPRRTDEALVLRARDRRPAHGARLGDGDLTLSFLVEAPLFRRRRAHEEPAGGHDDHRRARVAILKRPARGERSRARRESEGGR